MVKLTLFGKEYLFKKGVEIIENHLTGTGVDGKRYEFDIPISNDAFIEIVADD